MQRFITYLKTTTAIMPFTRTNTLKLEVDGHGNSFQIKKKTMTFSTHTLLIN